MTRYILIAVVIVLGLLVILPFVFNIAGIRMFQFGSVGGGGSARAAGGLLRSLDSGETWEAAAVSEDKTSFPREILDLVFHPRENNTLFIGAKSSGLWKSENGGASWRRVEDETGLLVGTDVYAVRFQNFNPLNLYLAVFKDRRGRVLKSEDGGKTFHEVYFVTADGFGVFDLWVNPSNARHVRIVTGQGGILETTNGSATWRIVKWFTDSLERLMVNSAFPNEMFVITSGRKIFKTFDGGDNWADLERGLRESQTQQLSPDVSVNPFGALLGGGRGSLEALVADPSVFSRVYVGSREGLFRSFDGGFTWRRLDSLIPPAETTISAVAIHPHSPVRIFTGAGNQLHKSEDNGISWSVSTLPTSSRIERLLIHPGRPETMFAVLEK